MIQKPLLRIVTGGIAVLLLASVIAYAWGSRGHEMINRTAARHLPPEMASFKADSAFFASHASDADSRRTYSDTSMYAEWPRHFLDLDDYPNFHALTHSLDTLIGAYGWQRVKDNGINPWATAWLFDSLVAQLGRNETAKARQTMADLGHYIGDAHQQLHCTKNYNGQLTNNYGIHSRYESTMISKYQSQIVVQPESARYIESPLEFAFSYIHESQSLVDSVLRADTYAKGVSGWNGSGSAPDTYYAALWEKTKEMTISRIQKGSVALASIWYTAWVRANRVNGVSGDVLASLPEMFELSQNYPNPFNSTTTISFTLYHTAPVRLRVFGTRGEEIATLTDGVQEAGTYTYHPDFGGLASGIYLYRLELGTASYIRKMVHLK